MTATSLTRAVPAIAAPGRIAKLAALLLIATLAYGLLVRHAPETAPASADIWRGNSAALEHIQNAPGTVRR